MAVWKPEHTIGLAASAVVGAAAGLGVGFVVGRANIPWSFVNWVSIYPVDAAFWATVGAVVVTGTAFVIRMLSQ
jgi:hypothetical protein